MFRIIIDIDEKAQAISVRSSHILMYLRKHFDMDKKLLKRTLQFFKKYKIKATVEDLLILKIFMENESESKWIDRKPKIEEFVLRSFKNE